MLPILSNPCCYFKTFFRRFSSSNKIFITLYLIRLINSFIAHLFCIFGVGVSIDPIDPILPFLPLCQIKSRAFLLYFDCCSIKASKHNRRNSPSVTISPVFGYTLFCFFVQIILFWSYSPLYSWVHIFPLYLFLFDLFFCHTASIILFIASVL